MQIIVHWIYKNETAYVLSNYIQAQKTLNE